MDVPGQAELQIDASVCLFINGICRSVDILDSLLTVYDVIGILTFSLVWKICAFRLFKMRIISVSL